MRITHKLLLVSALSVFSASAGLITSQVGTVIVDFQQFGPTYTFTTGPLSVENGSSPIAVTWTADSGSSVVGDGGYGVGDNGSWGGPGFRHTGTNEGSGTFLVTMMFSTPVQAFSAFLNYAPDQVSDPFLYALDNGGIPIESYNLAVDAPISTPSGVEAGEYRGISRASADIYGIAIGGAYIVADDISVTGVTAVPEPATGALSILAVAAAFAIRRLRR